MSINYQINKATEGEIALHLKRNSDAFLPALDSTVNIAEYAKKIAALSMRFEAWDEQKLIGLVACYFNDENRKNGFITNVSLDKEYGKQGIASKLIENCIEYAKAEMFQNILLEVNVNNSQAIKLYENYGFEELNESEETAFYQLKLK